MSYVMCYMYMDICSKSVLICLVYICTALKLCKGGGSSSSDSLALQRKARACCRFDTNSDDLMMNGEHDVLCKWQSWQGELANESRSCGIRAVCSSQALSGSTKQL